MINFKNVIFRYIQNFAIFSIILSLINMAVHFTSYGKIAVMGLIYAAVMGIIEIIIIIKGKNSWKIINFDILYRLVCFWFF